MHICLDFACFADMIITKVRFRDLIQVSRLSFARDFADKSSVCLVTKIIFWISAPIHGLLRSQMTGAMPTAVHLWDVHGYRFAGNVAGSTAASIEPPMASSTKAPAPSAAAPSRPESAKAAPTPAFSKRVESHFMLSKMTSFIQSRITIKQFLLTILFSGITTFIIMMMVCFFVSGLPRISEGEEVKTQWDVCLACFLLLPLLIPWLCSLTVIRSESLRIVLLIMLCLFIVTAMGLKPSPSGETFRFYNFCPFEVWNTFWL